MAGYPRRPATEDTDVVGARIGAQIVDSIVMILLFVVGFGMAGAGSSADLGIVSLLFVLLGIGGGAFYVLLLEGAWDGQTVGKKLFGIKVVTESGEQCGYAASLVRNLLDVVDGFFYYAVGLAFMAASDKRQRLGDRVADTVVVRTTS